MMAKKGLNKKAVSGVVTAVLLILLVMGAIATLWVVINSFISSNTGEISGSTACFTNQLSIESATWASTGTLLTVKVKRVGSGNDAISSINFFVNGAITAFTPVPNIPANIPLLGETKTYTVTISPKPATVEVAPVIGGKTCPNTAPKNVI